MTDFLFRGKLAELDPDVFELTQLEQERQARKLILIPSEINRSAGRARSAGFRFPEYLCRRLSRRRDALDVGRGDP